MKLKSVKERKAVSKESIGQVFKDNYIRERQSSSGKYVMKSFLVKTAW